MTYIAKRQAVTASNRFRFDPALTRIIEALADHMVDQDIRRMRGCATSAAASRIAALDSPRSAA